MNTKKRLQDLTIKDNFMFCAVMSEAENCSDFLELVLGIPIAKIEVSYERNIVYHPEYKGIRLDVYAKDENSTHYNVEMQVKQDVAITKRSRYYHSQMDVELLASGMSYEELPNSVVIFICDYDPFGKRRYCYSCGTRCEEDDTVECEDGRRTIYLSTKGENAHQVPEGLVKFLKFVAADIEQSENDFEDAYVGRLQKTIYKVKVSREMGERYMIFEEMMRDERKAGIEEGRKIGRAEGELQAKKEDVFELLEDIGGIPKELQTAIDEVGDMGQLKQLLKLAAKIESIEAFEKETKKILNLK